MMFFFFSSRRRHTRLQGDWSSDVCSSDLTIQLLQIPVLVPLSRWSTMRGLGVLHLLQVAPWARLALGIVLLDYTVWFWQDRKSTRLNSSHLVISYAVFCL